MQFRQLVEYVASCQEPEDTEDQERIDSVVCAVRMIADNAIRVQNSMQEAGTVGEHGENFRAYNYLQVYYLVMFREAFDGAMAEMFFMTYAANFAIKARGCPGMGRRKLTAKSSSSESGTSSRCLLCGEKGHLATSPIHQEELAEGSVSLTPQKLQAVLAKLDAEKTMAADKRKAWKKRIKGFWASVKAGEAAAAAVEL